MISDPLHPAITHFPVVLILLGTLAIITAFFIKKKTLMRVAVFFLVLAAPSAYYADVTGGNDYERFVTQFPETENTLNNHADNATWVMRLSFATAALALLALFISNQKLKTYLHILTIIAALTMSYSLFQTAHLGGQMVYKEALQLPPQE